MRSGSLPRPRALSLKHLVYGNHRNAWLVVRDPCAGCRSVYTVYRIELCANKEAIVIGRELPLLDARRIVQQDMAGLR